jgi:GGDEF domain-containing protein
MERDMKKMGAITEDVYNIDVFQVLLKYEIARSSRYPSPLTLIQIKTTPTAHNPETLRAAPLIFSAALNTHLRSADIPARSGDMFTILLPNSDKHGAQTVCERLLSVFKNKFEDSSGNSVTFSLHIGVTTHPGGGAITREGLLEKAEEGLTQSQRKGPNTYVFIA